MRITGINKSKKKGKRFIIHINDNDEIKSFNFGQDGGETYIDHGDETKRTNYLARHTANVKEKNLINDLIPSPALFSAKLLWGSHKSITENVKELQKEFNLKYGANK